MLYCNILVALKNLIVLYLITSLVINKANSFKNISNNPFPTKEMYRSLVGVLTR